MIETIQFKRGLEANLPRLADGEPAFCEDTQNVYIGSSSGNKLVFSGSLTDYLNKLGNLTQLQTTDKDTLVHAINDNVVSLAEKANQLNAIGWVNVVALGADNTGTNDSTSVIQSALNNSTYKVIYFPAGTYKVTNLSLTRSGVVLIGDSYWNTIIQSTATSGDIIFLNNNGAWRSQIRHLKIVGNNGTQNGVHIDTTADVSSEFTMDYVQINSCGGTGLLVNSTNANALYHSNFLNLYIDGNCGTDADITLNDGFIHNCYFYTAQQHGLKLKGYNCKITNIKCAVNGQQNSGAGGYGLYVLGARCVYTNVDVQQNCGIGIYFDDNSTQNVIRNAIIDGNGCTSSTQTGNSALLYEGLSMGGISNEVYGMVSDYYGSYQIRGYIKRYYSQKGCVVNVSDTTTKGKSFLISDGTPVNYIMKKASDLPASIVPNGTPAVASSYENVTYGSTTVNTLKLPPDNKLSFDVTKLLDRAFNLTFLMRVNFQVGDALSLIDFVTVGTFFKLSFWNKQFMTSLGGATAAMGTTMTTGDIYSISINACCTSTNKYTVYTYIYKFNPTSGNFESYATQSRDYDFTTQTDYSAKIGFNNKSDSPGLVIDIWNVSMGTPYINADQITYVTKQQLNSNHAIYLPCNGNLTPSTIV